ncbi:MAG: quinone oxidoreductase [Cyanobacteria bacterium P01_G01_bin.38]
MNTLMNAINVTAFGNATSLQMSQVPIPTPKANEVLVRNHAIGVNFVDTQHRAGQPYPVELPLILGIEAAGEVVAVGEKVNYINRNQRVAIAGDMVGIYAEYCVCPEDILIPLPKGVSYEQAASVLLQGMTAHALSHEAYAIQPGDTVLIQAAAGGVGLLLTQIAKMRGATVIGTCSTNEKATAIRAVGGDDVILYTQANLIKEVMHLTSDIGVHAAFDGLGKTTFDASLEVLRPRGSLVIYGLASGNVPPFNINRLSGIAGYSSQGCLSITWASLSIYNAHREDRLRRAETVLTWLSQGALRVKIAGRFSLEEASEAHRLLETRQSIGKILLIP